MYDPNDIKSTSDATIETARFAFELGREGHGPLLIDGREFVLSGKPLFVTDLEKHRQVPDRTRRDVALADPKSLVEYLARFSGSLLAGGADETAVPLLVGSLSGRKVVASLDYDLPNAPSWGSHTATFAARPSPEWSALLAANGKERSQLAMAEWFDEWNHIVADPSAAHMADVAANLQGSVNGQFEAKIVRANGAVTMRYSEDVETNNVKVPTRIKVECAPFEGTPTIEIVVRFQFRIAERKPVFKILVENVERIERNALEATFAQIEEGTGLKVLVAP